MINSKSLGRVCERDGAAGVSGASGRFFCALDSRSEARMSRTESARAQALRKRREQKEEVISGFSRSWKGLHSIKRRFHRLHRGCLRRAPPGLRVFPDRLEETSPTRGLLRVRELEIVFIDGVLPVSVHRVGQHDKARPEERLRLIGGGN